MPATSLRPLPFCLLSLLLPLHAAEDISLGDFEAADYGAWKATGTAFGTGPAKSALPNQMKVEGFAGSGLATSYYGGDDATGTLTSPAFAIERRYLNFLIGGGGFENQTCLNLIIDGKVVRTAMGPNRDPGGSERLRQETWDLAEFTGKQATLEIVDKRQGGWGHINVDQIVASDSPKIADVEKTLVIDQRYLLWPVGTRDSMGANSRVFFELDGQPFTFSNIHLGAKPDFWTFTDLADFQGRKLTLKARLSADLLPAWDQVKLNATFPGEDRIYQEAGRPQYHFTSRRGWINDPNGLVFVDGVWHMFYQHNPYNHGWDNMHWGHATSTDLLHWQEMPNALYPGPEGTMFSGSAFLLGKNASALPVKGDRAIALAYTAEGSQSFLPGQPSLQGAAISDDNGKTFTKYAKNPILGQHTPGNRDPKVFFHEPSAQWIMPLYLKDNFYGIFTSPDLVTWIATSQYEIPGEAECPDLFPMTLDGDQRVRRWIAWGANGKYMVGNFDGAAFQSKGGGVRRHYFGAAYAGQTFSNAPDGRRVHIGWMREGTEFFKGEPFNLQMTLPMDFTLRPTELDVRLWAEPAKEVACLRVPGAEKKWTDLEVADGKPDPLADFKGDLFEVDLSFDPAEVKGPVGFSFFGKYQALWNPADKTFTGAEGPQDPVQNTVRIHTFIDRVSMESFVNGTYVGTYIRQEPGATPVKLVAPAGSKLRSLSITPLKSVWR